MPIVTKTDPGGYTIDLHEHDGKYFPIFPYNDLDLVLPSIPGLKGRDDDVMILTYPKAGTNWIFEVANMLVTGEGKELSRHTGDSMFEFGTVEGLDKLPSVRLLNTHLDPDFYPRDLVKRKCPVIYVQRNPKDILTSFFYHSSRIRRYNYEGDWNSFFEFWMAGEGDYGRWFEWTKQWEKFFRDHPDIPVLRLLYEDMKEDLGAAVGKIAKFLGVSCDAAYREKVTNRCSFETMKKERKLPAEVQRHIMKGTHELTFRKGIVGDWKAHFTVTQNERFDAEYHRLMEGYTFGFEKCMSSAKSRHSAI